MRNLCAYMLHNFSNLPRLKENAHGIAISLIIKQEVMQRSNELIIDKKVINDTEDAETRHSEVSMTLTLEQMSILMMHARTP